MTGPSSERTADAETAIDRERLRRAVEDGERLYRVRMHGPDGETVADGNRIDGILTLDLIAALGLVDRLVAELERERARMTSTVAGRTADADIVREALALIGLGIGWMQSQETTKDALAALDRLVARNQQLQEALESGARYAEGVMLREADPFLRGIHQENLDKIRAALVSVRARTP